MQMRASGLAWLLIRPWNVATLSNPPRPHILESSPQSKLEEISLFGTVPTGAVEQVSVMRLLNAVYALHHHVVMTGVAAVV